jgi:hypothetical protein
VGLPISGYILDHKGLSSNFLLATLCLILFHVLTMSKVMELQPVAFVLWVLGRFFLFSSYFAYLPPVFGFATFGQVNGIISLASSVIGLLQYPLTMAGEYDAINASFLGILCVMMGMPVYMWRLEAEQMATEAALPDKAKAAATTEAAGSASGESGAVRLGGLEGALSSADGEGETGGPV